jgi:hypothetical protein
MMYQDKQEDWHDILRSFVNGPDTEDERKKSRTQKEVERLERTEAIAVRVGVKSRTIYRWMKRQSAPFGANFIDRLKTAIPEKERQMTAALKRDFGARFPEIFAESGTLEIGSIYYQLNVEVLCHVDEARIKEVLIKNIWNQMLPALDPENDGLLGFVAICVSPEDEASKVKHLSVVHSSGTGIWANKQRQGSFLWGGSALTAKAFKQLQPTRYPVDSELIISFRDFLHYDHIQSAIAFPIMRRKKVAGVLCLASVHDEDFFARKWQEYIRLYVEQLALAFDKNEYYESSQVLLQGTPSYRVQGEFFDIFEELASKLRLMYPNILSDEIDKMVLHRIRDVT